MCCQFKYLLTVDVFRVCSRLCTPVVTNTVMLPIGSGHRIITNTQTGFPCYQPVTVINLSTTGTYKQRHLFSHPNTCRSPIFNTAAHLHLKLINPSVNYFKRTNKMCKFQHQYKNALNMNMSK